MINNEMFIYDGVPQHILRVFTSEDRQRSVWITSAVGRNYAVFWQDEKGLIFTGIDGRCLREVMIESGRIRRGLNTP